MANLIYQFAASTVSLIFACALGVAGIATDVNVGSDYLEVRLDRPEAFAFGGIVFNGYNLDCVVPHERGHLIQERRLGPAYPLVIAIPSLINYWTELDLQWQEDWATRLGGHP